MGLINIFNNIRNIFIKQFFQFSGIKTKSTKNGERKSKQIE